ncbi:ras guanine nucleotide exchange factor domain-containing protein [Halteromyces radiatus]|uniref:ras guanine nucleotide exchange factor domain-containing protein n=1 Tax=Halteromyces radiatus TaxID=101107 RepID=UPI00222128D8|nr:ras guanine nucleotide exchange factor domain-containing protein [Halteromyces radiatus]KAI8099513.1 ras guanine nucleotide exchange factor domain-containing protein [Halteromyces radiatus]
MERAALATVFGVREYTEPKVLWEPTNLSSSIAIMPQQKPSTMGFSSNTTATSSVYSEKSDQGKKKLRSKWINKMKQSIQSSTLDSSNNIYWNEKDYDEKKTTLRARFGRRSSSTKQKHTNETVSTSSSTTTTMTPKVIEAATVEKLVEKLTVTLDYTFMTDFFLTYRTFLSPIQLCKLLILRFRWVIRHWLLNYFVHDFTPSRELREILTVFLNTLPSHPSIKNSPRDQRIVKGLKRVVRRLKKVHYPRSSQHVQVISPPPPLYDEQQVRNMLHAKLSQSPLRRKTEELIQKGMEVEDRHHGNVAFQDARHADIVVIGSSDKSPLPPSSTPVPPIPEHDQQQMIQQLMTTSHDHDIQNNGNPIEQSSTITDASLESLVSPGTTDDELYDDTDDDDDDDDDDGNDDDSGMDNDDLAMENKRPQICPVPGTTPGQPKKPLPPPLQLETTTTTTTEPVNNGKGTTSNDQRRISWNNNNNRISKSYLEETGEKTALESPVFEDKTLMESPTSITSDSTQRHSSSNNKPQRKLSQQHHQQRRMIELDIPRWGSSHHAPASLSQASFFRSSMVLQYRSHDLAQQLCLVERGVLLQVNWEEMVHCRWTKMANLSTMMEEDEGLKMDSHQDDNHATYYSRQTRQLQLMRGEQEGGVQQLIKRFNTVCQWVSSEIVRTPVLDDRKCQVYSNFATLVQILLGLQSPSVSRLRKTWARVSDTEMRLLEQLSSFTSPMKNWKHIRDNMTLVADEYGMSPKEVQIQLPGSIDRQLNKPKIKLPFGGCIPFLGLYLSDLVFNSEQPSYLEPSHDHHKIYQSYTKQSTTSPLLRQPLVNFRKYRIIATIIKRILTFQDLASRYSFEQLDPLYTSCLHLDALDTDTIRQLSLTIEPPPLSSS